MSVSVRCKTSRPLACAQYHGQSGRGGDLRPAEDMITERKPSERFCVKLVNQLSFFRSRNTE